MINNKEREYLSKLSFLKNGKKYSDKDKSVIDSLIDKGLIKVENNTKNNIFKVIITLKGKSLITNIDERDLKAPSNYKVSVYLCPIKGNKILLTKRLKHPQYGYIGLIAEKKKFSEELHVAAKRALEEETGMTNNEFKLIGNLHQIRNDKDGNTIEDGMFYVFYTNNPKGKLINKSIEGEYFWVDLDKVKTLDKIFKPSLEVITDEIIKRKNKKEKWENMFIYEFKPEPEEY